MADTRTKIGHGLAKALGIKLDYRNELNAPKITRGESVFSVASVDSYCEDEPTSAEWVRSITPTKRQAWNYLQSLVPFTKWITRYNMQWFIGDLVAGITIGAVVVPQGMGYAKLAELPVQYGLYAAFMGTLIYWIFATSKDITIGPVAVMSLLTGDVVLKVQAKRPDIPRPVIAESLAIITGAIVCFLGIVRLGWLVDLISLTAVSAFITGSAINIAVGQVPNLMGISGFDTRAAPYLVCINSLKGLPRTKIDAAMGLTALFMLYLIRWGFNQLAKKQPDRRKIWFFCNTMRTVFVILLYTMISWLVNLHLPDHNYKKSPFKILGPVPRGFTAAGVPQINTEVISLLASELPASVIVVLIEHISIAKSFGRINNYNIDPSQEMLAIGVTNLLAPFLGGYPATGSFSRTAIKSKAGVRTPLAGVITAIVVLLAIYALPAVFFYIPSASLAAVIIHAVGDLITPPNTVYQFWRVSPLEVFIFFAGVIVMVFTTIEDGVYVVISVSAALLLYRVFKARGRFLGRVKVHSVVADHLAEDLNGHQGRRKADNEDDSGAREIFLPINAEDGSNPLIQPQHPYPGIFIYRFSEGFNYPNANHYLDYMVKEIMEECRRTNLNAYARPGDRPWNDPAPRRGKERLVEDDRPTLKAVIMDFSSVNNVDVTSVQILIDVRNQLDRYAAPDKVQWHFACITNRWTKRALVAAGFGYPSVSDDSGFHRWKPVFSVAELGGSSSAAAAAEDEENAQLQRSQTKDEEHGQLVIQQEAPSIDSNPSEGRNGHEKQIPRSAQTSGKVAAVVQGLNRPFFHIDLTSALQSAINNANLPTAAKAEEAEEVIDPTASVPKGASS